MSRSSPEPGLESLAAPPSDGKYLLRLRTLATGIAWLWLVGIVLLLVNRHDFGGAGMPATLAIRFAVETLLFSALAYGAIQALPFGAKPGLRGSIVLALWIMLVVLSDCLSRLDLSQLEAEMTALRDAMGTGGMLLSLLVYLLALAIPFIPGVEIGWMIIMLFGPTGAIAVYVATIAGLSLAFAVGRLIPKPVCIRLLERLGVVSDGQFESAVRALLIGKGSASGIRHWLIERLTAYRYLSLALFFNLPGNAVIGGGGGIALLCGASRQFKWYWFVLSVTAAVTPIPVLVVSGAIDVGSLVHARHWMQDLFGKAIPLL